MLVACFGLVHDDCMYLLQELVHGDCTPNALFACYGWYMRIIGHGDYITNARFAYYRCEYVVLVLVVQLHFMGLAQSCS